MFKISKKFFILLIVVVGLLVLYFGIPRIYWYYQDWKIGQTYREFEKGFQEYLKKDVYGGKTPQETYEMYVKALKANNLELASKYYWWDRQIKEKERLEKLKEEGKLGDYIESLPEWGEMKEEEYWDKDGRRFTWKEVLEEPITVELPDGTGGFIEHTFQPGEYTQEIIFKLNKQANIWKLY